MLWWYLERIFAEARTNTAMTTRTRQERAALSIRGYPLNQKTTIYCNRELIDKAVRYGIISIGRNRWSTVPGLSSFVDTAISQAVREKEQKIMERLSTAGQ